MDEKTTLSMQQVASIPFFSDLAGYDLQVISQCLEIIEFKAYDYIFKEGDPYGSMYFLNKGSVQVLKLIEKENKQQILAEIKAPQIFGELALISNGKRSATILALEPLVVAELSHDNFDKLVKLHPELAVDIMKKIADVISKRLNDANINYVKVCSELKSCL